VERQDHGRITELSIEISKVRVCASDMEINRRDAKSAEVEHWMSSLRSFASLRFNVLDEKLESPYVVSYKVWILI